MFEPPDGGVAENVLQLALGLRACGWEPSVAGPRHAITYGRLVDARIPVTRLPLRRGYGRPGHDAAALAALMRILQRERFDVVHVHSAKAGVLGRIAAVATGTPVVYSPHCFPFVGPWKLPRRAFALGMERALGSWTDAILCVAEHERGLAVQHRLAATQRMVVVHNGCAPCDEHLDPDPELTGWAGAGPLAACLTVLRPQKAVHVFVDAAPLILQRVPGARLAVIGDGELRESLQAQARRLGVNDRLRFLPFVAPAARQLRDLDVYVLPSAWEAFPIALVEALACGIPQVATNVGGSGEAVVHGETGLLCPAGDAEALAAAVVELLADPARRRRMAASSRARYNAHFGLERMVQSTAGLYDATLLRRAVTGRPMPAALQWWSPRGHSAIIAVSGMDGSGKSSAAQAIRVRLEAAGHPAVVTRGRLAQGLGRLDEVARVARRWLKRSATVADPVAAGGQGVTKSRRAQRSDVVSWTWVLLVAGTRALSFRRSVRPSRHGVVVICDRWLVDALVDLRLRYGRHRVAEAVLRAGVPRADLTLLMRVDPAVAHERKPADQAADVLAAMAPLYREFGRRHGLVEVDAQMPAKEVEHEVGRLVEPIIGRRCRPFGGAPAVR